MAEALRLDGKVAVVTGAGRGLGRSAVLALAQAGADVALVARTATEIAEAAREVEALGRKALALPTDVTDEHAIEEAAEAVIEDFGHIDILINSAGIAEPAPLLDMKTESMMRMINVNLVGTILACRAFGGHMIGQRRGRIVNLASVAGIAGESNLSIYCATKGAVIAFTKALAVEWARHGITVNALAPGYYRTDLNSAALDNPDVGPKILRNIPLARFGHPAELGATFVYLASEASAFMTGSVLVIDGGQTAR